jgi:hypothetical protein
MNIISKYKLNKQINSLVERLYSNNIWYILLSLNMFINTTVGDTYKQIYNIVFRIYIYNNVTENDSKMECLVCYDTKNVKYKIPCCNKQYTCLKCYEKMFNIDQYKCLFCRKDLYKDEIIEISRLISIHSLFKINNICRYLYNSGYIYNTKTITKCDDNYYSVKLNNGGNLNILHNNIGDMYWHISNNNFILLNNPSFVNLI